MHIQIWCKTHNCAVGQVDPDTPVFEYRNGYRNFVVRWDNTYCYFDKTEYKEFQGVHDYVLGTVSE